MFQLPVCPCGGTEFRSGSMSIGGLYSANYTCEACGERVWVLSTDAGMVCIFMPKLGDVTEVNRWANAVLLPTWRARSVALKAHERAEWAAWLAEVFAPAFPDCTIFDGNSVSYYDLPEPAQAAIDAQFGKNMPLRGTYRPLPEELTQAVYPPHIPTVGVTQVWVATDRGEFPSWVLVDPGTSAKTPVPRDPILVSNEAYFDVVWPAVEKAIGRPLPDRVEVKNEYGGIEPWYSLRLSGATFIVGWRNRVVNVQVTTSTPFPTEQIRALAVRDDTTYYANGSWQSEVSATSYLIIHAWTREKLVEYLTVLCQAVA